MIKRMGVLAFIFSVWISMVIPGILIAQEVPSPPCAGCGGVPTTPKPFMVIPPSPLVSPTIPNALEYDGTNLWLTGKNGTRGSVFSGNAPANFNNTVTFGSSGVLDFNTGSVINFADGSVWKSTGLVFGTGTALSFPDGSAWDSSGLIFGTGGTETLPDGSKWSSGGLTFGTSGTETLPDGSKWSSGGLTFTSTFTNNGTISGGTLSGNTIAGAYTFSPISVTGPVPGQLVILSTVSSGSSIQLNIPTWANNIDIQLVGGGGGGASSTYNGGGGGYVRYIGPIINLKNGTSSNVICYLIGSGGAVGTTGGETNIATGTSCSSALSTTLIALAGGGGTSSANGSQGNYTASLSNYSGSIVYGNNGQAGCNSQQPGFTYSSAFCAASTSVFGTGGGVNSDGVQGVIMVKFYP